MIRTLDANLEDELYHFSVDQTMYGLSVDMSDEVTSTQAGFLGWAAVFYMLRYAKHIDVRGKKPLPMQTLLNIMGTWSTFCFSIVDFVSHFKIS